MLSFIYDAWYITNITFQRFLLGVSIRADEGLDHPLAFPCDFEESSDAVNKMKKDWLDH